jgi:uncharacterized membrane protein YfcA
MRLPMKLDVVEKSIIQDKNLVYTVASYSAVLAIFINLNSLASPLIGLTASVSYSIINTVFLGNAFFKKENTFFRLVFGVLLLMMLLSFVGWIILLIYNLDVIEFTLVLLVTTTLSSLLNRRMRYRDAAF